MKKYGLWFILVMVIIVRLFIFFQSRETYPDGTLIKITSKVSSEPIRYPTSQYLKLEGFKIYLPLYPEVHYRDVVIVEGEVEENKLKNAMFIEVRQNNGLLVNVRKNLLQIYEKSLPQPHSALLAGVTIGSKSSIPKDFWEALKASGTAHVVVASGMNVTLVAKFLIAALALWLPRMRAIPLAIIGVWFYALLSGFDAPIIRAAIMGSLAFTAQELGRISFAWRTLVLSAALMLFIVPSWLTDIGFILSFAATASLILFEAKVRKILGIIPKMIREDFSTSLAAQIGVAPILFLSFGQFNILSPLINAAVLWTIVPITIIGMVGGIFGLVFEPLGKMVLLLTYPLTSWFIFVVNLFVL